MFPRFREQIGTALDLIVEFSTLGEYRLGAGSAPGATGAPAGASEAASRLGGLPHVRLGLPAFPAPARAWAEDAADRQTVAGGAAGCEPAATPAARRPSTVRPARVRRPAPSAAEQLCLAI
jgi:hypothetical protein